MIKYEKLCEILQHVNRVTFVLDNVGEESYSSQEVYEAIQKQGIDRQTIEESLSDTAMALAIISEICVEESKLHISPEEAITKVRQTLVKYDPVGSRRQLKELLDKLAEGG